MENKTIVQSATEIEIFNGIYSKQMNILRLKGLVPATLEETIRLMLNEELSFYDFQNPDGGVAYAGNRKDKFKIIKSHKKLLYITPTIELYDNGIKLSDKEYDEINAQEFSRRDISITVGRKLTQREADRHLGWSLLIGDKELLPRYIERIFKEIGYDKTAMGFYVKEPQEVPNLCPFLLTGLNFGSELYGSYGVNEPAHLVGLRKKVF